MVVCVGSIALRDTQVLFVRQAKNQSLEGQWSIPWGVVETGETPEAAALRETWEESGVLAQVDGLLGLQNLPTTGWMGLVFLCHALRGEPTPDGVETDAAIYLSRAELAALAEPLEPWCRWLADRILSGQYQVIRPAQMS